MAFGDMNPLANSTINGPPSGWRASSIYARGKYISITLIELLTF